MTLGSISDEEIPTVGLTATGPLIVPVVPTVSLCSTNPVAAYVAYGLIFPVDKNQNHSKLKVILIPNHSVPSQILF